MGGPGHDESSDVRRDVPWAIDWMADCQHD
jgi:hypothetical protein